VIRRALCTALALCAVGVAPASRAADATAPEEAASSVVELGPEVLASDSLSLSSHAANVASALDIPPIWLEALPPPPKTVTRQTKMYGTVTIDHVAHLQRRVACRACHGPGPVKHIVYTPRVAHDRCRGCHAEIARGPTDCRGCHVMPTPAEALATAPAAAPVAPVAPPPPPTLSQQLAALVPDAPASFHRTAELGVTTLVSHGQFFHGPTVHLVGHYGDDLLTYTLSIPGGPTHGRTQFLVGGGHEFALSPRLRWSALGVAGLDATYDPGMVLPGAGLRLGLELTGPWRAFRTLAFQVTALADLASSAEAGRSRGDVSVGFTLSAGMPISR
jgi:hypothetical protein